MAKYAPLQRHLAAMAERTVACNFKDLDEMVGGLPNSAYRYPGWWSNTRSHVQGNAWTEAGWRVSSVDMTAHKVIFTRVRPYKPLKPAPIWPREARARAEAGEEWTPVESLYVDLSGQATMFVRDRLVQFSTTSRIGSYGRHTGIVWYHEPGELIAIPSPKGNLIAIGKPDNTPGTLFARAGSKRFQLIRAHQPRQLMAGVDLTKSALENMAEWVRRNLQGARLEVPPGAPFYLHELCSPDDDNEIESIILNYCQPLVSQSYGEQDNSNIVIFSPTQEASWLMFIPWEERHGYTILREVDQNDLQTSAEIAVDAVWWGIEGNYEPSVAPMSIDIWPPITREMVKERARLYLDGSFGPGHEHGALWEWLEENREGKLPETDDERASTIDEFIECVLTENE